MCVHTAGRKAPTHGRLPRPSVTRPGAWPSIHGVDEMSHLTALLLPLLPLLWPPAGRRHSSARADRALSGRRPAGGAGPTVPTPRGRRAHVHAVWGQPARAALPPYPREARTPSGNPTAPRTAARAVDRRARCRRRSPLHPRRGGGRVTGRASQTAGQTPRTRPDRPQTRDGSCPGPRSRAGLATSWAAAPDACPASPTPSRASYSTWPPSCSPTPPTCWPTTAPPSCNSASWATG